MLLALGFIFSSLVFFELTSPCTGAIGVVYNQHGIVRDVFEGSPADKAGIKINDKILDRKSTRGKPGTVATVNYIREGMRYTKTIDRVCTDDLSRGTW